MSKFAKIIDRTGNVNKGTTYQQWQGFGSRYTVKITTKRGHLYYLDSADELTEEQIIETWKNRRPLFQHFNGSGK